MPGCFEEQGCKKELDHLSTTNLLQIDLFFFAEQSC